ncbi:MAG: class I SAM-dependent methyltransferase [Oscillospiraceae bacterium]
MANINNTYGNQTFFEHYKNLCESPDNAANIEERPTIMGLLPDLKGKAILDLSCGYGVNCMLFSEMGAEKIMGIDVSPKMIEIANQENSAKNIKYQFLNMTEIDTINERFDIVFCSLAFNYIADFTAMLKKIHTVLEYNGTLIFSQEHPFVTAPMSGSSWTKSERGKPLYYNLADYMIDGKREIDWFVSDVIKYHRCFSTIINNLINADFIIEKVLEPIAPLETMSRLPHLKKELSKPNFLIIRAKRN